MAVITEREILFIFRCSINFTQQDLLRQKEVVRLHRQAFGLPVTWYKVTSINVTFSSLVLMITYVSEKSSSLKQIVLHQS